MHQKEVIYYLRCNATQLHCTQRHIEKAKPKIRLLSLRFLNRLASVALIMKKRKQLVTFDDVVEAFGGVSKLARFVERSPSTVCNWRKGGYFPPKFYWDMIEALEARRCVAPRLLWRFEDNKRRAA